jgi:UDP-N-acetylmuramoyl-tripeptide--D-alanyl-D-alanine ligase
MSLHSLQFVAGTLHLPSDSTALIADYQIDSRHVTPGTLFFALPGEKSDGHRHLAEVKKRGAIAAIVSSQYKGEDFGLPLFPVPDVLEALHTLARAALTKSQAKVIGVTGSVGKTTTKEFIVTLLGAKYRVGKTEGNQNTKLTLPLALLRFSGEEEVLVLEMGMSEPSDLSRLVSIAPPDIGVVTKVGLAHAAFFPDGLSGIARGKREIFSHPKTATAIFDHGCLQFEEWGSLLPVRRVSFSTIDRTADFFLGEHGIDERGLRIPPFPLPFHQPHILHNFLAAAAVAREMKLGWDEIERRSASLRLPSMRFEQLERGGVLFINDAYNASPDSMKAALSSFPEPKAGGKKIAVLGSMKELGVFSEGMHREIGEFALPFVDHLLTFGVEAKGLCGAFARGKKPAEHFEDRGALKKRLQELLRPGDSVLVKGSLSLSMGTLVEEIHG